MEEKRIKFDRVTRILINEEDIISYYIIWHNNHYDRGFQFSIERYERSILNKLLTSNLGIICLEGDLFFTMSRVIYGKRIRRRFFKNKEVEDSSKIDLDLTKFTHFDNEKQITYYFTLRDLTNFFISDDFFQRKISKENDDEYILNIEENFKELDDLCK